MRALLLVACLLVCPTVVTAQQPRADQIAARFNKHKNVVAMKRGVVREKYKDVHAEPAIIENVRDVAGRYEVSDFGWWIDIQVDADGRIQGTGYEAAPQSRTFDLRDARLEGALLTATKVYRDGTTARFEAVFLNRTVRESPTDSGDRDFGLGVLLERPLEIDGNTFDKLFFELEE